MQCQVEQLEIKNNNVAKLVDYVLAESVHGIHLLQFAKYQILEMMKDIMAVILRCE